MPKNVHPFPVARPALSAEQQKIADAVKLLLSAMSPSDRKQVLREIAEQYEPIPPASGVHETVVRLLPRRAEWTVEQLKQEIAEHGVQATAKAVYNSLGYLTRRRRIRRVGYGRYLVDDGLLVTAEDLPGIEPARDEDD